MRKSIWEREFEAARSCGWNVLDAAALADKAVLFWATRSL